MNVVMAPTPVNSCVKTHKDPIYACAMKVMCLMMTEGHVEVSTLALM